MSSLEKYREYVISIKLVTPIIIGSSDYLNACDYVLAKPQQGGNPQLLAINFPQMIGLLTDKEQAELLAAIENNPLSVARELNKFTGKILENTSAQRFAIPASASFENYINNRINNTTRTAAGELSFQLFQRTSTGPYIPGSSFKGAIRTALAFKEIQRKPEVIRKAKLNDNKVIKSFDTHIFGYSNPLDDPFRQLRFTDSNPVSTYATVERFIKLKAGRLDKGAQTLREAILPASDRKYYLALTVDNRMVGKSNSINPKNLLIIPKIVEACRMFYKLVLEKDLAFYQKIKDNVDLRWQSQVYEALNNSADKMIFPIKLGLGTSNYSKSFKPFFEEKCPVTRKVLDTGVEYSPIGWAIAEVEAT